MASERKGNVDLLAAFYDGGVFTPLFGSEQSAVTAAYGMAGGRPAYAVCQNGEAIGAGDIKLSCKTLEMAAKTGNPVVSFYDSPGMKLEDGLAVLEGAASLNKAAAQISGVVPQIAVVTGVCGASSAMAAAGADVCIMAKDGEFFLTAPFTSKAMGDAVENAGSAEYAKEAGVSAFTAETPEEAAIVASKLVSMLPSNNISPGGSFEYAAPVSALSASPYSAEKALEALADEGSILELYKGYGENILTAFATVCGNVAGFVVTGGEDTGLCSVCAGKAARFVRFCDAFSIPVVSVLNTGGFVKANSDELAGGIRSAARLASTYADATTAKINVVTGKLVGTAFSAFAAADLTVAAQGCVIAPVEPKTAVSVLYKKEIEESGKPIDAVTEELAANYSKDIVGAAAALESGIADFTAEISGLRPVLESALEILETKRVQRLPKKHGNMAL